MKNILIIVTLFLLSISVAQGQFDRKFTFDFGVGYAIPNGESLRDDNVPYFYSNLLGGISFMAQAKYNLNPKMAIGLKVDYSGFSYWFDPRTTNSDSYESFMNIINIGPIARYRVLNGKFSPFFVGGIGLGIYNGERASTSIFVDEFFPAGPDDSFASIDYVILREPGVIIENNIQFSGFAGLGFELDVSQSVGIFVLGTYNYINSQNDETLRQNILYPAFSAGVNLNFVKSKTL